MNYQDFKHQAKIAEQRITTIGSDSFFPIASGSFGKVYLSYSGKNDLAYIVKEVTFDVADRTKVLREIAYLNLLHDRCKEYVICWHDAYEIADGKVPGTCVLTTGLEFDVFSLASYLKRNRSRLRSTDFLLIMARLSEGLYWLHRKGVVHRDIKPQNVVINPATLVPKYIDFGMACLKPEDVRETKDSNLQLSREDMKKCLSESGGTPVYMPPEVTSSNIANFASWRKADVYSLGMTFYFLLAGKVPFESKDLMGVIYMIHSKDVDIRDEAATSARQGRLFQMTAPIVNAMVSKEPTERPFAKHAVKPLKAMVFGMIAPGEQFDPVSYDFAVEDYVASREEKGETTDEKTRVFLPEKTNHQTVDPKEMKKIREIARKVREPRFVAEEGGENWSKTV